MENIESGNKDKIENDSFLGMSPDSFDAVNSNELVGNVTAIKMLLHYYKQLTDDNKTLKNNLNTYKTYADSYDKKRSNSTTSTVLLLLSNISIAFGVNLLTSNPPINAGWFLLGMGGLLAFAGFYFTFFKDRL